MKNICSSVESDCGYMQGSIETELIENELLSKEIILVGRKSFKIFLATFPCDFQQWTTATLSGMVRISKNLKFKLLNHLAIKIVIEPPKRK